MHHFDIGIRCISLECTLSFKQNDKPCLEDQTLLRPNQSGTPLCFFKYIKRERTSLQKKYIDKFLHDVFQGHHKRIYKNTFCGNFILLIKEKGSIVS